MSHREHVKRFACIENQNKGIIIIDSYNTHLYNLISSLQVGTSKIIVDADILESYC